MAYPSKFHSEYLDKTRVLFDNISVRTDLLAALVEYGYTDTRLFDGKQIFIDADKMFKDYYDETQKRNSLSRQLKESEAEVKKDYVNDVGRLRLELIEDEPLRARLGLNGRREKSKTGIIGQAVNYYNTVIDNPDILTRLEPFGVTLEKMQAALAKIVSYQKLESDYKHSRGECQRLRVERDKLMKRLRRWVYAFITNCKIAFAENLQTLEIMGYFIRNQKKTASKTPPTDPSNPPEAPETPEVTETTGSTESAESAESADSVEPLPASTPGTETETSSELSG